MPAKGFKFHNGQTAKILATYDGLCNCTKIYINDKLRGIADPFDVGQYVWQPFPDVANNFFDSITLGHSVHSRNITPPAGVFPTPASVESGTGGRGGIDAGLAEAEAATLSVARFSWRKTGPSRRGTVRHVPL